MDHAKSSVKFVQTARAATKASTIDVIVDVGPQPTIWSNMQTPEFSNKARLAFTGKKGKDQIVAMLAALSSLFEKGFNVDFEALFNQMPYKFAMTDVPTYPFQRLYNYPAYICSRSTTVASILNHVETSQQKAPTPRFVVDQPLCDFLDLHRIEGRRVLPGAAMVDFFARAAGTKSIKSIKFHTPLVLETPETQVRAEIDEQGAYKLVQEDGADTFICSGTISDKPGSSLGKKVVKEPEMVPLQMMSKPQIYECFKNVQFGEPFRTVQGVRIWADHADADIKLEATANPAHDRIRKLDACLHLFGAISSRLAPPMDDSAGAYLPASLEDFTLHTDEIPYNFTCRYYLPLDIGRNARVLSSCFEVFSDAGVLLVSCRKYSVAWVPRGVVHKEQKSQAADTNTWLRNGWTAQDLPVSLATPVHRFDEILYLGNGETSRVLNTLSSSAKDCVSIEMPYLPRDVAYKIVANAKVVPREDMNKLPSILRGQDVLVVLDLSKSKSSPGSEEFTSIYLQALMFLKLIMSHKLHVTSFLALTSWSAPVDLYREGLDLFSASKVSPSSLVGAIIQGMIRVFRRETGLDFAAWCLDLANVDNLADSQLQSVLTGEIQARYRSEFMDTFVSYREDADKKSLCRLVPSLESLDQVPTRSPSGPTVIVGMGSIGTALAVSLVEAGCKPVIFFGRRPQSEVMVGT